MSLDPVKQARFLLFDASCRVLCCDQNAQALMPNYIDCDWFNYWWVLGFADWPHVTVLCAAPRMVAPLPLHSSALPLPPQGSSQTALSASQACSMLMQCDHFQPSTSLCHVKGIYILHYQLWSGCTHPGAQCPSSGSPVVVSKPSQALKVINDLFQWWLRERFPMLEQTLDIMCKRGKMSLKRVIKLHFLGLNILCHL